MVDIMVFGYIGIWILFILLMFAIVAVTIGIWWGGGGGGAS